MGATTAVAAVDLGSSSGRVVLGRYDGATVAFEEVRRFPVHADDDAGALVWDVAGIVAEVRHGLDAVLAREEVAGVAVDTWGVDHAVLRADGTLATPVHAYRDPRTTDVPARLDGRGATAERLWELTGVQPDPINTTHQLVATLRDRPEVREQIDAVLMLPDHVAHLLGGERGWSRAICSTSGLCTPGAQAWSTEVMDLLALDPAWFGELSDERTAIGPLAGHAGTRLLRGGSHDTACAVHALPPRGSDRVFLSSGSWSLIGVELDEAVVTADALEAGLTNEVRTDGGVRLIRNLTGLWILQECQRQWAAEGRPAEPAALVAEAREAASLGVVLDPAHPDFARPGAMADRVVAHLRERHGTAPGGRGQLVRTVLESLAVAYAREVADLARLTGTSPDHVVVVGGGVRNTLLVEMTAAACRLPVVTGAAEASAVGSVLAQLQALGHLGPDDGARVLAASVPTTVTEPGAVDPVLHPLADLTLAATAPQHAATDREEPT